MKKKNEEQQHLDPYAVVVLIVTTIAQMFGIPQSMVQLFLLQTRRVSNDKLLDALKTIYKILKKYGDELDE